MTFAELLRVQDDAQQLREGKPLDQLTDEERVQFIRIQLLGALDELHEVLHEVGWKPWKTNGYASINRDAYLHELADVVIFVANLALAIDADGDEFAAAIRQTQAKNADRMAGVY